MKFHQFAGALRTIRRLSLKIEVELELITNCEHKIGIYFYLYSINKKKTNPFSSLGHIYEISIYIYLMIML